MKKNYDRKSKLSSYSAMAGSFLAIAGSAHGQIRYSNVNPDAVLTSGGSMVIDLDTNGTQDFSLAMSFTSSSGSSVVNLAVIAPINNPNNAITGSIYQTAVPLPYAKNLGDTIKASLPWNNNSLNFGVQWLGQHSTSSNINIGNFLNTTNKFIGVRFMANSNTYYGWIRVSLNSTASTLTINDYAYQANGGPIICGQITGIEKSILSSAVHIHSFEKTVYVNVDKSLPLNGEIQITNLLGETIQTCKLEESAQKIDLSSTPTGVYFVTLHHAEGDLVKKIYIN